MENVDLEIDASPTKELFIFMLIRDITLIDAIGDLIDNCVDGALGLRPNKDYSGLWIEIIADKDSFVIRDNCGGISYETAKNYAFRFGRTSETPSINGSLGQFGIGMKRALFKMGRSFKVTSISQRSSFNVFVNVDEWKKITSSWKFKFTNSNILNQKDKDFPVDRRGTEILITNLNSDIKERFELDAFITSLKQEIELEHLANINRGLKITINGMQLESHQFLIINSDQFKPSFWEHKFPSGLYVKAIVGVSEHDLRYGGWYIFCNDRMILGPEQTEKSGWGANKPTSVAKYHGQYDRFRGYVYFEAKDTSLLPWNTSKNDVDVDSPIYRYVLQNMVVMMKPVISFLNKLHAEAQKAEHLGKPLKLGLEASIDYITPVSKVFEEASTLPVSFTYPTPPTQPKEKSDILISYYRNQTKIDKVMKALGTMNTKVVGEKTFDYFYDNECED